MTQSRLCRKGRAALVVGAIAATIFVAAGASSAGAQPPRTGDLPVWSPDGKEIAYVAPSLLPLPHSQTVPNSDFDVMVMSASGHSRRVVASVGRWGNAVELRWAGDERLVASTGALLHIDLPTGRVVGLGDLYLSLAAGETFAISSDGRWVAFTADSPYRTPNLTSEGRFGDVFAVGVVSTAGGPARLLPQPVHASDAYPSFSPDGTQIVLARTMLRHGNPIGWAPPALMLQPVAGGDARPLGIRGDHPVWSPNGRWIAYQHLIAGASIGQLVPWTLDAISPAGEKPRTLLPAGIDETLALSWSPDSTRVAFITQSGVIGTATLAGKVTIFKLPHDLSLTTGVPGTSPQWSPDGKTLLFAATPGARLETYIYAIGANGRGLHRVG